MTLDDLTVSLGSLSQEQLLAEWSWLIQDARLPILLTAAGDAFLQSPVDGSIHFLDTGGASLEQLAASIEEFQQLLSDKPFVVKYLAVQMVGDLINSGKTLGKSQIYSLVKPHILGGEYTLKNIAPADIEVHFSLLEQIHKKVIDLPDGASVQSVKVE